MLIKVIEKCFVLDDKVENYGIRTYMYETTANNFDKIHVRTLVSLDMS